MSCHSHPWFTSAKKAYGDSSLRKDGIFEHGHEFKFLKLHWLLLITWNREAFPWHITCLNETNFCSFLPYPIIWYLNDQKWIKMNGSTKGFNSDGEDFESDFETEDCFNPVIIYRVLQKSLNTNFNKDSFTIPVNNKIPELKKSEVYKISCTRIVIWV